MSGIMLLAVLSSLLAACAEERFDWTRADPASQGLDPTALEAWAEHLQGFGSEALLLVRNDRLVFEWYAEGREPQDLHHAASLSKGLVAGLALALLIDDGRLELDDPAADHVAAWRSDPVRSRITLRQLASHSSGLEHAREAALPKSELAGWKGAFWRRDADRDPVRIALTETPVIYPPGRGFAYSAPGYAALSFALTSALREAPERDLRALLRERIMAPIGVPEREWGITNRPPIEIEDMRVYPAWGGSAFSPRAMARIARLMLRRGDWEGKRLIAAEAVEAVVHYAGTPVPDGWEAGPPPVQAAGWWTNALGTWPRLPRDAFLGVGGFHQLLLVIPSLDLIAVRVGKSLGRPEGELGFLHAVGPEFLDPLMDALPAPPVPWSSELTAWFEPASGVKRAARGSDNWPMTWTGGGDLFTSYGDGRGFEPYVDEKLSLGFARITGGPEDFKGANVRAPTGERTGGGRSGAKTSGLLAVDGALYAWVRNLANSQLAWSEDEGGSWTWGFRFDQSFGSPSFLNMGRAYSAARDEFVYVYSQDGPSAYESDDQVVLARAPLDAIRNRDAYEFFAGFDAAGAPRWTRDLAQRRGVIRHRDGCRRIDVAWNPDLERYLMALGFDHDGGWGIFSAPEPWGPWQTVYFTPRWDLGRTHSYRLPTKWIEDGGRSLHVVLSGKDKPGMVLDAFCVREARLVPVAAAP